MEQANYATQSLKDTHSTVVAMKAGVKQMQKEFKKINISEIDVCIQNLWIVNLSDFPNCKKSLTFGGKRWGYDLYWECPFLRKAL